MREGMDEVCAVRKAGQWGKEQAASAAAVAEPGSASLTGPGCFSLPVFGTGVPPLIGPQTNRQRSAQLALMLLDAGLVTSRTAAALLPLADSPADLCHAVLDGWLSRHLPMMRHLHPRFHMGVDQDDGETILRLSMREGDMPVLCIGAALMALEERQPGLGRSVLSVLNRQNSYHLFTPATAMEECSAMFWCGEDNEDLMLEEHCETDAEQAEMRNEIVRRDMFDDYYPSWAIEPDTKFMPHAHVRRWGKLEGYDGAVAHQLAALLRLSQRASALQRMHPRLEQDIEKDEDLEFGVFIGYGALLHWHDDNDVVVRVYDDVYNMAMQGESDDRMSSFRLRGDDATAMQRWCRQMAAHLKVVGVIDSLLALLADPY